MEKKLKILLIIVAVIGLIMISDIGYSFVISGEVVRSVTLSKFICIDSDANKDHPDGKNYFVAGFVRFGKKESYDKCLSSTKLKEFYCKKNDANQKPKSQTIVCKNGCLNGACLLPFCGDGTCQEEENALTCQKDCDKSPPTIILSPACPDGCCTVGETITIVCSAVDSVDPNPVTALTSIIKPDGTSSTDLDGTFTDTTLVGAYTTTCTASDSVGNTATGIAPFYVFAFCCGDRTCQGKEDCNTCPIDCTECPPAAYCGDSSCNANEDCHSCPTDCGGCPILKNYKEKQIALGKALTAPTYFDSELQDDDISYFLDSSIFFQGTEYDIEEKLQLIDNLGLSMYGPYIATSLTSAEPDYKSNVYLEVPNTKTIRYVYAFSVPIALKDITGMSSPLAITFLGKPIKINYIIDDDSLSLTLGEEHYLTLGESVVVEGKTVTLKGVTYNWSAVVDVDGETATIPFLNLQRVGGIEVFVKDLIKYKDDNPTSSAVLIIGKETVRTYNSRDPFIGENPNDPNWRWQLGGLTTLAPLIAVDNDFVYNDIEDNPPAVGGCINLPCNYVSICLDNLTVADASYRDYTCEYQSSIDVSDANHMKPGTAEKGIYCHTSLEEGFVTDGSTLTNVSSKKTRELWIIFSGTEGIYDVYYYDKDVKNEYYAGSFDARLPNIPIARVNYENTTGNNIILSTRTAKTQTIEGDYYLLAGMGTKLGDKTVTVTNIGSNSAVVDVNGKSATISTGSTLAINGVEVTVINVILRTELGESGANLHLKTSVQLSSPAPPENALILHLDIKGDTEFDLPDNYDNIEMVWGLTTSGDINSFGLLGGGATAESDELKVMAGNNSGIPTWKPIGTYDEDHRSKYGIIIKNPDSQGANDAVSLMIPNNQVKANVKIGRLVTPSPATAGGSGGAIAPV